MTKNVGPPITSIVANMPWPPSCRHCALITEDPDAFFYPAEWDGDDIPDHHRCYESPTGVHESRTLADYGYRA